MKNIYIAGPLFNEEQKRRIYEAVQFFRSAFSDMVFYVPMEHQIPNGYEMSNDEWAKAVFDEDVAAIREADEVWAFYEGLYSDTGTAWEIGFAYALEKPVHLIPTYPDSVENPLNVSLMVFQSTNLSESAKMFFNQT